MSSAVVGDVAVRVGANIEDLKKGMAEGSRSIGSFSANAGPKLRNVASNIAKAGAAAAVAGAAMVAGLYVKGSQAIDAQAKLAKQLNTTSASMATLNRAGGLAGVGIEKITAAGKKLDVALGQAARGEIMQAEALDRIGLSAQKLSSIPLDQRILAINNAIKQNIPAAQQAAAAADLFGSKNATAILSLDSDTIDTARKQTELFGLALSDVDAAKVEQANDAMGVFGMAASGFTQQLTVELAPILKAIGERFLGVAEEAGGMGTIASKVVDGMVTGFGFVLDVFHGIRVAAKLVTAGFQGLGTAIITVASMASEAWFQFLAGITDRIKKLIGIVNKIPGVDIPTEGLDNLTQAFDNAAAAQAALQAQLSASFDQTKSELQELAMMEMPSEKFKQFAEEAEAAAQKAAEASVISGGKEDAESGGMSEPDQKAIEDRLEKMREGFLSESELLAEKYAADQEMLQAALEAKMLTEEQYQLMSQQLLAQHEEAMTGISDKASEARAKLAEKEAKHRQSVWKSAWTGLTSLMNSESRKLFEIGKTAAISQSIIATYQGMAEALKLGFPQGLVAAALVGAKGFADVAAIRSQSFGSGGGAAGSATQQVSANTQPVQQQETSNTYRFEGLSRGAIYSGDQMIDFLSQAEKDGMLRGKLSFAN